MQFVYCFSTCFRILFGSHCNATRSPSQPANQRSNCLFAFKYSGDCVIAFGTCTGCDRFVKKFRQCQENVSRKCVKKFNTCTRCDDPFFGSCPGVLRHILIDAATRVGFGSSPARWCSMKQSVLSRKIERFAARPAFLIGD